MNACVISTFRCNAKCHMCDIWKHPTRPDEEISPETLDRLPSGLGRVNLTGGEPMLRSDIEEFVKVLSKKAQLIEISTNGYFTDRIIRIAEKYHSKVMFRISIEGLPKLNDELRGIKNGFDHALRTVLALKKTKVKDYGFSIVICDKSAPDLIAAYQLSSQLGVEFGNSTMHNSWYFHKYDNALVDEKLAIETEKKFIEALLDSQRNNIKMRIKDWLRAYFNLNILKHLEDQGNILTNCCAGRDLFFVDPHGNVMPCNGSDERWIMGNIKEQSWNDVWSGPKAEEVRRTVDACKRSCAFIGTARFDMMRRPWKPVTWVLKNKMKLKRGQPIDFC